MLEESPSQAGAEPQPSEQQQSQSGASDAAAQQLNGRQASHDSGQSNSHASGPQPLAGVDGQQQERPSLHNVQLAPGSLVPELVQDTFLELPYYPGACARAGLLEIQYKDIAVNLCEGKKMQAAFGVLESGAPTCAANAAMGMAMAIVLANETNAKRSAGGEQ